ncbi:MAG TPA: hypothetical protein VG734_20130 [Lacunisphaera sp.]|nr:hypothetical protein [Lacunisphaera sp.]
MAESSRRNRIIAIVVAIIVLLLLLIKCQRPKPAAKESPVPPAPAAVAPAQPSAPAPGIKVPDEVLTAATVQAPAEIGAGAKFTVAWTGPNNPGDYVTIVRKGAPEEASADYRETKTGPSVQLTAPIEPGEYEVRYATGHSHKVLGRAPVKVIAAAATLEAVSEAAIGATVSVAWSGPDNAGDYVTLVAKDAPEGQSGNYTFTKGGSPLTVVAPTTEGDGELRYMTGQGDKVIGRRAIRLVVPAVSLSAPAEAAAGSTVQVEWKGPNYNGDFVTLVASGTTDGEYGNYAYTRQGSPVPVIMPIMAGAAELRYMTGQGNKVLGRRPIRLVMPEVALSAPAEATVGSAMSIGWTGPGYPGDYVTVVEKTKKDGEYGDYVTVRAGVSPINLKAPQTAGAYELRYMTGQGGKVLGRRAIAITP